MNQVLQPLLAEFRASARIRWGTYLLLAMAWGLALSEWHDHLAAQASGLAQQQEDIARLAAFEKNTSWATRAEEAEQLRISLTRGYYVGSRSQAQAQWRDLLSSLAAQQKLKVIDLAVTTTDLTGAKAAPDPSVQGADPASGAPPGQGEPETLRARLVFEFSPPSATALLLALGRHEKKMVVDRLTIRNRTAPGQSAQAELELRAFLRPEERLP